jgi:hypothetical protein
MQQEPQNKTFTTTFDFPREKLKKREEGLADIFFVLNFRNIILGTLSQ